MVMNDDFDKWYELYKPLDIELAEAAFLAGKAAQREIDARIAETPVSGEQDDITMTAKDRVAAAIRGQRDE